MSLTNFYGSVVINGGVVSSSKPTVHYTTCDFHSAPPVDAHGPTGAHEARSPNSPMPHMSPSTVNTSSPATRPQRSFPRSFSLDGEAPSFPIDLQRSSTLPLPSLDSSQISHNLPPDWPAYYTESADVVYGFRMPIRRDSAVPFQPIGNPLQQKPIPRQRLYGPMPHALPGSPPPVIWGGDGPTKQYSPMPMPVHEATASSVTSWPVDDRDADTTDGAGPSPYPDQPTYC